MKSFIAGRISSILIISGIGPLKCGGNSRKFMLLFIVTSRKILEGYCFVLCDGDLVLGVSRVALDSFCVGTLHLFLSHVSH